MAQILLTLPLLAGVVCTAWAASCDSGRVELQVLGSGGPELGDRRASASYLLWLDGRAALLVDFGGGAGRHTVLPVYEPAGNALMAVAFSGDTSNRYGTLTRLASGVDLLVAHNAVPEAASGIARELHMPPSEIGRIAAAARVKAVLLSHRMRRTLGKEEQTVHEIAAHYRGVVRFADDLERLVLPLASSPDG